MPSKPHKPKPTPPKKADPSLNLQRKAAKAAHALRVIHGFPPPPKTTGDK